MSLGKGTPVRASDRSSASAVESTVAMGKRSGQFAEDHGLTFHAVTVHRTHQGRTRASLRQSPYVKARERSAGSTWTIAGRTLAAYYQ